MAGTVWCGGARRSAGERARISRSGRWRSIARSPRSSCATRSAPAVASAPVPNDEGRMAMSWAPSILAPWRLAYGLRKHPSTILLIVQVLGILSYPLMENTGAGRAVFGAMSIAVLSLVLWVVNRATAHWVAWLLAVPSVLMSLLAHFAEHTSELQSLMRTSYA